MKKLIGLLREYYQIHFNRTSFLLCVLLCAVLLIVAYDGRLYAYLIGEQTDMRQNSYQRLIEQQPASIEIVGYCILYFVAFVGAYLLQAIAEKDFSVFKSGKWWFLVVFSIVLFSVRGAKVNFRDFFFPNSEGELVAFYDKVAYNLGGLITLVVPCFIYWLIVDKKNQPLYGLHAKAVSLRPYFIMLALMVPLIVWAGAQSDFLCSYPSFNRFPLPNDVHRIGYVSIYEIFYGMDFIFTEFFFRGFLILAFASFGHRAILPMCVFYVTIHFGKPAGEAISSFFGGLILGIIAFRTRSIYGGIIIHLGIAYLMEIVAMIMLFGFH